MRDLDKDVVMELYDKLHRTVALYMSDEYIEEAVEAVILLTSTAIQTKCAYFQTNVEHTLEDAFDSMADYTHGMMEDELEED